MRKPMSRPFTDERPRQNERLISVLQNSLPLIAALEQISRCKHCTSISELASKTPVQCTKYAGSQVPISVNLAACHTCGEYKSS